jgi:isoleucyl-tRNA synthetase
MLEIERRAKNIGSSLEAKPIVYLAREFNDLVDELTLAEVCITSGTTIREGLATLAIDVPQSRDEWASDEPFFDYQLSQNAAAVFRPAEGRKCARSWKILPEVGSDPDYPDLTLRDAAAMREFEAARQAAE